MKIKLSSAGLVYRHYGHDILETISAQCGVEVPAEMRDAVYWRVYNNFVEAVDAIDNGIPQHGSSNALYGNMSTLSSRIAIMNPKWNDADADENDCFHSAMLTAQNDFLERAGDVLLSWPARDVVQEAFRCGLRYDDRVLVLPTACPWKAAHF